MNEHADLLKAAASANEAWLTARKSGAPMSTRLELLAAAQRVEKDAERYYSHTGGGYMTARTMTRKTITPAAASESHEANGHGRYDASCTMCVHMLAHALGHGGYVSLDEELHATAGHAPRCTCDGGRI